MIYPPIENFSWKRNISQLFGVNADTYKQFLNTDGKSIPGHNGIDIFIPNDPKLGYGTKVLAAHNGKVAGVYSDFPTKTKGNGLSLQKQLDDGSYIETIYWHLADFTVILGQDVKQGEVIGLMGNTGFVIPHPSKFFPYMGTHLHFGIRKYSKDRVLQLSPYAGYIDPVPFLFNAGDKLPISFFNDLMIGKSGNPVSWLQTLLKLEGLADYEPTGFYGSKTMSSVRALQLKYGLTPAIGYCGYKTRRLLTDKYA